MNERKAYKISWGFISEILVLTVVHHVNKKFILLHDNHTNKKDDVNIQ